MFSLIQNHTQLKVDLTRIARYIVSGHSKLFDSSLVNLELNRRGSRIVSGTVFKKDTDKYIWKIKCGLTSLFSGPPSWYCHVLLFLWFALNVFILFTYSSNPCTPALVSGIFVEADPQQKCLFCKTIHETSHFGFNEIFISQDSEKYQYFSDWLFSRIRPLLNFVGLVKSYRRVWCIPTGKDKLPTTDQTKI